MSRSYEVTSKAIYEARDKDGASSSHGWGHIVNCLMYYEKFFPDSPDKDAVRAAVVCHDLFDHKYLDESKGTESEQLRRFLIGSGMPEPEADKVVLMTSLVSISGNRDRMDLSREQLHYYIPRFCDRLDSIGIRSIDRSFAYGAEIHRPEIDFSRDKVYFDLLIKVGDKIKCGEISPFEAMRELGEGTMAQYLEGPGSWSTFAQLITKIPNLSLSLLDKYPFKEGRPELVTFITEKIEEWVVEMVRIWNERAPISGGGKKKTMKPTFLLFSQFEEEWGPKHKKSKFYRTLARMGKIIQYVEHGFLMPFAICAKEAKALAGDAPPGGFIVIAVSHCAPRAIKFCQMYEEECTALLLIKPTLSCVMSQRVLRFTDGRRQDYEAIENMWKDFKLSVDPRIRVGCFITSENPNLDNLPEVSKSTIVRLCDKFDSTRTQITRVDEFLKLLHDVTGLTTPLVGGEEVGDTSPTSSLLMALIILLVVLVIIFVFIRYQYAKKTGSKIPLKGDATEGQVGGSAFDS